MFEQFRKKFPHIDNEKWNNYVSYFKRIEVPSKTILLSEGEISKKMFLIEKGCIRVCYNHNGKDITTQFFIEKNIVGSIESFRKQVASEVSIETIEPSAIWWISKRDADKIIEEIKEIPVLRDHYINAIFERTFTYIRHFVSFIKDTPQERYLHLINEKPQIIQRVPQHYIASYLGITKVHLSRLKNKMSRMK